MQNDFDLMQDASMGVKMLLRDYQEKFLNDIRSEIGKGYKAICAVAPTGSGKTVIIAAVTKFAINKGNRVYIIAHRRELVDQISNTLNNFSISHGIVSPNYKPDNSQPVQVCSVDTLIRRLKKYSTPNVIIVDECHHLANKNNKWGKCAEYFESAIILGMTATPIRTNGQGLGVESGGFFDTLVEAPNVEWLTEQGYLSPARYFVPPQVVDLSGVRSSYGDYNAHELEERLSRPFITGDAIQHYKNICPNSLAIAFCASVRHAQAVASEFSAAGIPSDVIHGNLDKVTRKNLIDSLGNGTIKVLASVDVISEGTDVPRVETAILLRPTQSLCLHLQQVGRVLRPFPSKQTAFIIDHVGNTLRHGFADSPRTWTLAGTKKSKKNQEPTIAMKQCPNCYCCHKPSPVCPSCGHKYKVTNKNIKVEIGELKELTKEEQKRLQIKLNEEVKKATTLDELKEIETRSGYKTGWAQHKFEGKQIVKARYDEFRQRFN